MKVVVPKSAFGRDIELGSDAASKRSRRRSYRMEALFFAVAISLFDALMMIFNKDYTIIDLFKSDFLNYGFSILFNLVIGYVIAYFLNYLFSEISIKRYNKKRG